MQVSVYTAEHSDTALMWMGHETIEAVRVKMRDTSVVGHR